MLDEDTGVFYAHDTRILLTPRETLLLSALIKGKGSYVKNEKIIEEVFKDEPAKEPINALRIALLRLKKKVKGVMKIKAMTNYGYKIIYLGD